MVGANAVVVINNVFKSPTVLSIGEIVVLILFAMVVVGIAIWLIEWFS